MNTSDTKFTCTSCGSESKGTPGTCCSGAERKEVCHQCDHAHKDDGSCDCGCA